MEISKTYNPADTEQRWYQYWVIILLIGLLLGCQSPKQEKKTGNLQKKIDKPIETNKEALALDSVSKVWELIKAKAKNPFSDTWKVPESYNPALTCTKMTQTEFELLGLKDSIFCNKITKHPLVRLISSKYPLK
jgi:hypothetical protein